MLCACDHCRRCVKRHMHTSACVSAPSLLTYAVYAEIVHVQHQVRVLTQGHNLSYGPDTNRDHAMLMLLTAIVRVAVVVAVVRRLTLQLTVDHYHGLMMRRMQVFESLSLSMLMMMVVMKLLPCCHWYHIVPPVLVQLLLQIDPSTTGWLPPPWVLLLLTTMTLLYLMAH